MLRVFSFILILSCLALAAANQVKEPGKAIPRVHNPPLAKQAAVAPESRPEIQSKSSPLAVPWYQDHDWLSAISSAVQAFASLLALAGAAIAVFYARRSWLASEHTLAASVRPIIGIELDFIDDATGDIRFRLKNLGNGVAIGVFFWLDRSAGAESYWTWSKWPFRGKEGDQADQIAETLEVDKVFSYQTTYPNDEKPVAFIFCAFDVTGNAIQTKSWIGSREDGSPYLQSKVNVRTAEQVLWFYDVMTLRYWGFKAFAKRVWSRAKSAGY